MATATPPETMGDLLDRFGRIPPERILMHPTPGTATEADVLEAAKGPRKRLCELVDGVLVEKTMGYWESQIAFYLGSLILSFVRERKLGAVSGPDGPFRLRPGSIRMPDIAFTSWQRLENEKPFENFAPPIAPELAIEILSRSNTPGEMVRKREDYFKAGVQLVWEIDPLARTARCERSNGVVRELQESDSLDGEDILPGFMLRIADFIDAVDRP